jgi:hypothetical protein
MATYEKKILSGSTDGRSVLVAATASAGTVIHTGSSTSTTLQEVWLYASNSTGAQRTLTVQWGGTTSPNDSITLFLPAQSGLTLVVPGLIIQGNATPLVVRAFADSANQVSIAGYINEIA